jgi:sugar phosphate permease
VREQQQRIPPLPDDSGSVLQFEKQTYQRVTRRLMPFLFLCYIFAYVDRVNVGFAKLQMQQDLGMSDSVYGVGAGLFFIGYFFFEIPCNLMLKKIGARRWLGPIMIVWGLVSASTLLVKSAPEFYLVRFALGLVESGFFPGVILYLTFWYPGRYRAKMVATFMTAVPLSGVIGGPISGWILERSAALGGLRGWQWLYLFEAIPSLLAGIAAFVFLHDGPHAAKWLKVEERDFLIQQLEQEESAKQGHSHRILDAVLSGKTWLLCFIYFGFVMGNYGLGFWLPQIVKDTITHDPFAIGLLTMIPWAAAALAMVIVGHHSDKTNERRWHVGISGILGAAAFAACAIPGVSGTAGLLLLTVAAAGISAGYSTYWALPTTILTAAAAPAGIAWINSVGNLAGYVSPAVIGKIRDATHSMSPVLLLLAACAFAAAMLTIVFFRGGLASKREV